VATFVLALAADRGMPAEAGPPTPRPITGERLRHPEAEPENWLTYSGNYYGHRHSPLTGIDRDNVKDVVRRWVYEPRDAARIQTSPLAVDGILYLTERANVVTALDGATGRPVWTYRRPVAFDVSGCCGPVNRGLALLGDTLYYVTYDARLVALDRYSGTLRWEVEVADPKEGYSSTGAPLVLDDKVVVGIAGGELGVRGFLDAYDATTGKRLWRTWTVPGPGEPGNETWAGDSWKTGGAPTWVTGSYDAGLGLIYWGTGNPSPDYNGDARAGDNLYSSSLLALDAATGKIRWHFQFTPHDLHDWDASQVPVLVDQELNGHARKLVVQANKNCFYYVLDRETGEFLNAAEYTTQTWAKEIDARGRPVLLPEKAPSTEGTTVSPGLAGGTNWFSPSYSPEAGLFFVRARRGYVDTFYKSNVDAHVPGHHWEGGRPRSAQAGDALILALDVATGRKVWAFEMSHGTNCGVLTTASGLVFSGDGDGHVFALDDRTGRRLWDFETGAGVVANPIAYEAGGEQYVVVVSGRSIVAFGAK
jgi:alcohol dehydrogenase (cytochrome c)